MKRIPSLTIIIAVFTAVLLLLSGCDHESNQDNNSINTTGNVTGIIYVDYARGYENLGELAGEADLIVIGTINRTETVPDEATMDKEDPRARMWNTRSVLRVEKSIKGDFTDEITIIQTGAKGWAEEPGNPVFEPGERCFLFLRKAEDNIYYLVHPDGRFGIEDDNVFSMNYVLPTGQARPLLYLTFWRVYLDDFISRVIEAIKSGFVIPEEEPVISMNLSWVMRGRNNVLSIYEDGTLTYIKEWDLRPPRLGNPPKRTWRIGKITMEDVTNLLGFLDSVGFNDLEEYTQAPDPDAKSGVTSDLYATISAHTVDIDNSVTAFGFFTPEIENPYKKLPYPLDEIYTKLTTIAEEETEEAYREEIERNIVYEYPDEDE